MFAEKQLLFGLLALQNNFVTRDALLAAFAAWVVDKQRAMGDILVEQGHLAKPQVELLLALTDAHVQQHGNSPEQSLAAVSSVGSICDALKKLGDPQLDASLAVVASHESDADPYHTEIPSTCAWSGDGQRFRVLRPHAKGGLGEVFVAQDLELNREVALKEIQSQYADHPANRSRFVVEAEITGGLEHPGIVPVYGLGQYADGRPFMRCDSSAVTACETPSSIFTRPTSPVAIRANGLWNCASCSADSSTSARRWNTRIAEVCCTAT